MKKTREAFRLALARELAARGLPFDLAAAEVTKDGYIARLEVPLMYTGPAKSPDDVAKGMLDVLEDVLRERRGFEET